jgi:ABC-type nickel/cobalt efflux system permease component RcnA
MKIAQVTRVWFWGGFLVTLVAWLVHASSHREAEMRQDIYADDLFARALYKNVQPATALTATHEVFKLGTQDARWFFQAGMIALPPGVGGLPTVELGLVYHTPYCPLAAGRTASLHYRDSNCPGRAGWQEIIAVASPGMTVRHSSVSSTDRGQGLTQYPTDLLHSPPQVLQAKVLFTSQHHPTPLTAGIPSSPEAAVPSVLRLSPPGPPSTTPHHAFTDLISTQTLSLGVICLTLAVAVGLGALHALEPGHGKTVVAAYLVGARGTAWHALCLGLIVTVTHTAGVYLLGFVTLYASRYVVPEQLYPWLSFMSGVLIAGLGGWLLFRRLSGRAHAHPHPHTHGHTHPHPHVHPHAHGHPHHPPRQGHDHAAHGAPRHHHDEPAADISYRQLLTLGVTGGIVPCPAALVVLLSAVALQRTGFGLVLIVAFSAGLAAVLIAIGLCMVYASRFMTRFQGEGALMTRWLPLTSAAIISVFGLVMVVQALVAAGVLYLRL